MAIAPKTRKCSRKKRAEPICKDMYVRLMMEPGQAARKAAGLACLFWKDGKRIHRRGNKRQWKAKVKGFEIKGDRESRKKAATNA